MLVYVVCPRCGKEVEGKAVRDGGDWVDYGSTRVQLPSGWEVEYDHYCRLMVEGDEDKLYALLVEAADSDASAYGLDSDRDT